MQHKRGRIAKQSGSLATAIVAALIVNIPLLTAVWTSVKSDRDIARNPLEWPSRFSLSHFRAVLDRDTFDFIGYLLNSVSLSLGAVGLTAILAMPAAYAITKLGVGGNRLLSLVTSVRILPPIFFIVPLFLLFRELGLLDMPVTLIIANTMLNIPIVMLVYSAAFVTIPDSLQHAGEIDGASSLRILISIMLPLMRPAIASGALLTFVFSWADYLFALVLTDQDAVPLTIGTSKFVTSAGIEWGNLAAAAVLSVVAPLLVVTVAQKHFVRGLATGALKE